MFDVHSYSLFVEEASIISLLVLCCKLSIVTDNQIVVCEYVEINSKSDYITVFEFP